MEIDSKQLITEMITAAKAVFDKKWPEAKTLAELEFKSFVQRIKVIGQLRAKGILNDEQARLHMDIQKNSMRIVLLTIEGLGILIVEQSINAAINVISNTVNTALGFAIL